MRRRVAFVALSLLAITFLILGDCREANFLSDLWSQLFLLTTGTLSTTFVLDAILKQDNDKRARAKDAFAFRSFSAHMLSALQEMAGVKQPIEGLPEAAISGNEQFAAVAKGLAAQSALEVRAVKAQGGSAATSRPGTAWAFLKRKESDHPLAACRSEKGGKPGGLGKKHGH